MEWLEFDVFVDCHAHAFGDLSPKRRHDRRRRKLHDDEARILRHWGTVWRLHVRRCLWNVERVLWWNSESIADFMHPLGWRECRALELHE
ncbi:hypothetical protein DVR09_15735 (plasmid) [Erythrobacter aureus]|uniref:Uncharacterized protein n=1 Tax=Erythrobacter aureus TaxID=2182384 RepID=A0A345YJ02_9SPHN|nr:hypothetical protein DVR09_15735 [Erythrobacter aureus]